MDPACESKTHTKVAFKNSVIVRERAWFFRIISTGRFAKKVAELFDCKTGTFYQRPENR
jgi:hypothetical protein